MVASEAANVQKEKSDSTKRGKSVMGIMMQDKLGKDKDTGEVFRTALFGGPSV